MSPSRSLLVLTLCASVLQGCSADSPTGPTVTFTDLPAAVLTAYCVQGQRLPGQPISGTLAITTCDAADLNAVSSGPDYSVGSVYQAIWHVRVAKTGTYQFAAFSDDPAAAYDNVLNVYHLDSYTATTATLTEIGYDDDSGAGPNATDALLSVSLTAGQDYFLRVAGWADGFNVTTQSGPYTATFTGP
ncbi:MAG TPA: hypothetical protein VIV56_17915 [Gemmatimonadales bacterium]